MQYISLVGTQIMAVLNPLLALAENGPKPDNLTLLPTSSPLSQSTASMIAKHLVEKKLYAHKEIKIITISRNLFPDENGNEPSHKAFEKLTSDDGQYVFNLAGGLNFQIAACVQLADPERCLFVYPESTGIYTCKINSGQRRMGKLPLPKPLDVLGLQGIPYTQTTCADHALLASVIKQLGPNGIEFPVNCLAHIEIKGVVFDRVWNIGNELRFLKVISSDDVEAMKNEARVVMALASDREAFGELYHRSITVMTEAPSVSERIGREGGGKVGVIRLKHRYDKETKKYDKSGFDPNCLTRFKELLVRPPSSRQATEKTTTFRTEYTSSNGRALIVPLGQDMLPTMKAVWTHKPRDLHFLYTPDDPKIAEYKNAIVVNRNAFPVESVTFHPVSIVGDEALAMDKPANPEVEVNITPGTKGHSAFPTLWAKLHRADIFSLVNETGTSDLIPPSGKQYKIEMPPIDAYLQLLGYDMQSSGEGMASLESNKDIHGGILKFLAMINDQDENIDGFPHDYKKINGARYRPLGRGLARIEFWGADKHSINWSTAKSIWFERLIGYAFIKAGATDVRVRIRTNWSKARQVHLEQAHGETFMSDIDVVASYNLNYYVISCKATDKTNIEATAREAKAFSSMLGRFPTPLVAFLRYKGDPFKANNNVYAFGYKTFTDTGAMKNLLDKIAQGLRR